MGRLQGKVAVVIGGSGGIGGAIACAFAAEGARLAIAGRTEAKVETAVSALQRRGTEASGHAQDIAVPGACAELMQAVVARHGALDILVNSQGILSIKPAAEVTEEEYDRVLGVNLRSVFFACQAAYGHMLSRGGAIINIASLSSHFGWPRAITYAASKHGVIALTKTLACEWASNGVRVNSITPGFFLTDLNRERLQSELKNAVVARTPAGRLGELDELASAAVFLASDEARFVTGADLAVDGGYMARGI